MNKITCNFVPNVVAQEVYLITSDVGGYPIIHGIFYTKEKADKRVIELEEENHPHMYGCYYVNKWVVE